MKGKLIGLISIIIIGALLLGLFWDRSRTPATVSVEVVTRMNIQSMVEATGTVVPAYKEIIKPQSSGDIGEIYVQEGDKVEAGQVLAQIDTTTLDSQIKQLKASLTAARLNEQAALAGLELARKNDVSQSYIDELSAAAKIRSAESALAQAKATVLQLEESLKQLESEREKYFLKAKISGTVLEVNGEKGGFISAEQPLLTVATLDQMEIQIFLNEVDASKVKVGQEAVITSKVLGTDKLNGVVSYVGMQAITQNNLPVVKVLVKLASDNESYTLLKPGYTVSVNIVIATRENVLAIPQWTLSQEGSKNYVYIVDNDRLEKREIQLGIADEVNQEVIAGLNEGDLIVANPSTDLYSGMEIKVQGDGEFE